MTKIGLISIGLETYWQQYDGLLKRLLSYDAEIGRHLSAMNVKVISMGMVDSAEKSELAAKMLKENDIDLLCIFISTYALSSTVLPVAQAVKCPTLLLCIQPAAAINYERLNSLNDRSAMTAEWLAHCQSCSLPELAGVFNRAGIRYDIVSGHLDDEEMWNELREWMDATNAVSEMRKNRLGVLGHYYCGMLDVYSDTTLLSSTFGTTFELLEMCELKALRDSASEAEIEKKLVEFGMVFKINPACPPKELKRAALTSIALDKLATEHQLGSLAYYFDGSADPKYLDIVTSMIAGCTLLTGRGIPTAGECEIKNALAMKIMSSLGAGGSFSEPYAIDFDEDITLWGHDGPGHFNMAEDGVSLVPLTIFHGKPGDGLSIQMSVRQGDVTFLSVCHGPEGIYLLVAEGESVAGENLHIGNTNSRYRFPVGAKEFMTRWSKAGPSHHCAIGIGHVAGRIEKFGALLGIPVINLFPKKF